jgi:hypothetical protein
MKFEELVHYCKNSVPRPIIKKDKKNIDYICESIFITLHNEVQFKTIFIVTDLFPPLKIFGKQLLKIYIKECLGTEVLPENSSNKNGASPNWSKTIM